MEKDRIEPILLQTVSTKGQMKEATAAGKWFHALIKTTNCSRSDKEIDWTPERNTESRPFKLF